MICLDTHAVLWWALDPGRLSPVAAQWCARMQKEGGCASSISLWEIGLKIKQGALDIGMTAGEFSTLLQKTGCLRWIPVTPEIWLHNLQLDWDHRDPADRTIVATALGEHVPLLTCDADIRARFPDLAVW